MTAARPQPTEYPAGLAKFVEKPLDGDILRTLSDQGLECVAYLRDLPEDRGWYRPSDDRWSLREIIGHLLDYERVMACAALHFARGHECDMPNMNAQEWVDRSEYDDRTTADLCNEFEQMRASHVQMFGCFEVADWTLPGSVGGEGMTPRSIAWLIAGHTMHHMNEIRESYV